MNCMMEQTERQLQSLRAQIGQLGDDAASQIRREQLRRDMKELLEACRTLSPADKVYLARHPSRPGTADYISALFTDFFEQQGDRLSAEDGSIYGGIALFHGKPVTVMGHRKGKDLQENLRCNFGMPNPEGYRKALRLMKMADLAGVPVITFIDTPGAFPGVASEERHIGEAIAVNLRDMFALTVPVVAVVIGEGGSGGALGIGVGNTVLIMENAYYSVITPEGCAAILWKDRAYSEKAAEALHLTAGDLTELGLVDGIVKEPLGGAHKDYDAAAELLKKSVVSALGRYEKMSGDELKESRYERFRRIAFYNEPSAAK